MCDANVDMVFMLDQSGSVGQYNHDIALYFLRDVVSFYNISPNATQVTSLTLTLAFIYGINIYQRAIYLYRHSYM